MSNQFYDYIQESPTTWLRHHGDFRGSNFGWHFCFAGFDYSPGSQLQVYVWGDPAYQTSSLVSHTELASDTYSYFAPSTEQFFGGVGQTQRPFNNLAHVSSGVKAFCTDDGKAYVLTNGFETQRSGPINPNGLGPVPQERIDAGVLSADSGGRRNTPRRRNTATRIAGKDGELLDKDISYLSSTSLFHLCLLDSSGSAWFCGVHDNLFTQIGAATNAQHELLWPTKVDFTTYEAPAGTITLDSPIKFTALFLVSATPRGVTMCALSDDGKIFQWRGCSRDAITSSVPLRWFEITQFVTSATVTNGGSNYTGFTTQVVFSAPQHPNGITAQGIATVAGGVVTRVEITEPGWGYTSAPTFTVIETFGGATASGAEGTTDFFTGTWEHLYPVLGGGTKFAAIDSDGRAYYWWTEVPRDQPSPSSFIVSQCPFAPPGQHPDGYKKIAGPLLLAQNGDVDTFGLDPYAPSRSSAINYSLTRLSAGFTFVDVAYSNRETGACLTADGDIYTFGDGGYAPQVGQGNPGASTGRAPFDKVLGSAKWLRILSGDFGFFACRDESFDADGNRIDPIPPGLT